MNHSFETMTDDMDFATLLEASLAENTPERGDIVTGTVMAIDHQGLIVDIGWKRDGLVSRKDLERLNVEAGNFTAGQELDVMVVRLEDYDGNLVLSISQARQNEDWKKAEELMQADDIFNGEVIDANKGGLIVPFGNLRGFVPASHVADLPRGLGEDARVRYLTNMVGHTVAVKIIEVNRKRRRLVLSQRDAQRGHREARKELLLEQLAEGGTCKGVVSGLRDFGAFVDLGGADGLIHISELAWHRVEHPREVLNVGDEVTVYVLRLDQEGKRIGLSLKRLQENPWTLVDNIYHVGELVTGTISRVTDFGAFVSLDPGIEALLHISQLGDAQPEHPSVILREGQKVLTRIISIESDKQRLGLSLKEVAQAERDRWQERQTDEAAPVAEDSNAADDSVELESVVEEITTSAAAE